MLKIYKLGDDILRQKCEPMAKEELDDSFRELVGQMFDTMLDANGCGLAAPQVGITKRFFVIMADDDVRRVFVNPVITRTSAEQSEYDEGCLSIPGVSETITRPVAVTVSAMDEFGRKFTIDADGLLARAIQHENDHLEGVLYIDRGDAEFKQKTVQDFERRAQALAAKKAKKEAQKAKRAARKNKAGA